MTEATLPILAFKALSDRVPGDSGFIFSFVLILCSRLKGFKFPSQCVIPSQIWPQRHLLHTLGRNYSSLPWVTMPLCRALLAFVNFALSYD